MQHILLGLFVGVSTGSSHRRIPTSTFYPPGVLMIKEISRKTLPRGNVDPNTPAAAMEDWIESILPETRLTMIDASFASFRPDKRGSDFPIRPNPVESAYIDSLKKFSTMDPGIFRLLARYAVGALNLVTESHLDSASAIVRHIQSLFPDGEFDHITPEYIMFWYSLVGGDRGRLVCTTDASLRERIINSSSTKIHGDNEMLLGMDLPSLRWMLQTRRHRLVLTGYEFAL